MLFLLPRAIFVLLLVQLVHLMVTRQHPEQLAAFERALKATGGAVIAVVDETARRPEIRELGSATWSLFASGFGDLAQSASRLNALSPQFARNVQPRRGAGGYDLPPYLRIETLTSKLDPIRERLDSWKRRDERKQLAQLTAGQIFPGIDSEEWMPLFDEAGAGPDYYSGTDIFDSERHRI